MILLLSTAFNLYWLGRYVTRVDALCRRLPFEQDEPAVAFAHAFSLSAWNAATLNQLMLDPEQPESIPANLQIIRENMQSVRGVISQQAFETLNWLTNPQAGFHAKLCDLISQCSERINQENDTVRLFWQLGQSIEHIDHALRLKHSPEEAIMHLRTVVERLSPIGWQNLEQPWLELQREADMTALYSFCDHMQALFEEGP